jgi:hypothetical protein
MAEMWLKVNAAGSDLENVASVVFRHCVVAIRASQATLNGDLVCIGARCGSLCKPQRDQQSRYYDQQECSLHGNPPKILALRRSEISLGILNLLPILMSNPCGFRGSGVRTWSIQVKPHDLIR